MFQEFKKYSKENRIDFSINPATLAFRDNSVERVFTKAYFQSNLKVGRVCHLVAIFFYGIFAYWEANITNPSTANIWLWVFLSVAFVFLFGFSLSFLAQNFYEKYWQQIFAFYVLMTGIGLAVVTVTSSPYYPIYNFVGVIFCLIFCYCFIRIAFVGAVGMGNLIVVIYIASSYFFTEYPLKQFLTDSFYLFGINLLGMMVSYSLELMSRRDFILNEMLKRAENKTKEMNINLEHIVKDRTKELVKGNQDLKVAFQREKELVSKLENEEFILQKSLDSLQQQQQLLDSIGQIAHVGGWSIDTKTNKLTWTKEVYRIFEIEGKFTPTIENTISFWMPESRTIISSALETLMNSGEPYDLILKIKTVKGNLRWAHAVGDANIKDGNIVSIHGSFQDITERKLIEKKRKQLEAKLQQSHKMESIGTLAGGIAHDFNNILFPILGYSEMLLDDVSKDSPFRDSLSQIYTGARRASELVKQILTFSRQENGELKLMKMQPILKEALKLIRSTIPTTIEIEQDISPACGVIKADPTQIHQIVMNLATNAYHAMEDALGELKVSLNEVELGGLDLVNPDMATGVYACLTVADTGKGMDKNLTNKIFDPFFTTKEKGKGTGMGLSVVHGIVKSMNGAIQVYSEPGKGTVFNVYLPVEKSFSTEQISNSNVKIQTGTEQILLVDDEEAILSMEKQMLERLGYQVTPQTSSIEALESFRSDPDKFDLVITDMAMPNIPGNKLAIELNKIRPDIPILLCTGFSEIMSEEKATPLGIKGFLLKPIVMKDLAQKIREVLDSNKTENTN